MDDKARSDADRQSRGRRELDRLRAIARLFDQAFAVPGTKWRFGIDALFGLVPGLGDIVGALVAVYAMHVGRTLRVPAAIQLHMLGNIGVDALVGSVPLVGDLFDFVFKAQTRNLALLDAWVGAPEPTATRSRRGLLLLPIAVLTVFILLTVFGIYMLYLLLSWIAR